MQRAEVRIIREALEAVLSPSLTSAVLFEALEESGDGIPQSHEELRALVRGTLSAVLERRVGAAQASHVLSEIEARLLDDGTSSVQIRPSPEARDAGSGPFAREDEATTTIPTARDPVTVVVVAGSRSFASRLSVALGPRRVAPITVATVDDMARLSVEPAVVVVDSSDFAAIDPTGLARALGTLSATTLRTIWGSDLPYGRTLVAAMSRAGVSCTALDRREGIDPLLDMVRARQRTG